MNEIMKKQRFEICSCSLPHPIHCRWETENKYYIAWLEKDLFKDWILIKAWGSKYSKLGSVRKELCDSYHNGIFRLQTLDKKRRQRGYLLINIKI